MGSPQFVHQRLPLANFVVRITVNSSSPVSARWNARVVPRSALLVRYSAVVEENDAATAAVSTTMMRIDIGSAKPFRFLRRDMAMLRSVTSERANVLEEHRRHHLRRRMCIDVV